MAEYHLYYETIPTGIEGLDNVLGGGFIRGRTYLISGETGTAKTLTALTFLIQGALKYGEPGIYISVDETYEQFVEGARRFGWDIEDLRARGLIEVLVPEMDIVERIREKDPTAIAKSLVASIREYVAALNAQRLVIDPIAPLVSLDKDVQVLREYIRVLVMSIEREIGTTNIITTEIPSGSGAISRYGVEEFLATGVFIMGIGKTVDGQFKRVMFIRKMRWSAVHPGVYEIEIVPKAGIIVKGQIRERLVPVTYLPTL
ncbi:MAG: ATPase domain-containing protein [Pyrobaculum sp.]|uniref:RecA-superfamily ATPases implicated in signal transduction n=1 Tax=Pyrobaculum oguniense (strain DSM 13380 / JCM 10595 / TE7) TaxID=698757 RepID=H6QDQ5_PYROT|nr:RecA-superfamily ATPases implicated in signal transduction [Pyrobaculum oguniense TE7]